MNILLSRRFLAAICILLSLMLVFCSCDLGGGADTDTDPEQNTAAETETETETETEIETEIETETETETETQAGPAYVTYKITVIDENGTPVVGAMVQLCQGDLCRLPVASDENGIAMLEVPEADYTAKVFADGYTSDADGYSFPEGSYELTITVTTAE